MAMPSSRIQEIFSPTHHPMLDELQELLATLRAEFGFVALLPPSAACVTLDGHLVIPEVNAALFGLIQRLAAVAFVSFSHACLQGSLFLRYAPRDLCVPSPEVVRVLQARRAAIQK